LLTYVFRVLFARGITTMGWRPRMAMKKEEAKRAVLREYDSWAEKHSNTANMMGRFLFFRYLQEERSDLLDFRAAGSKWQIVHGWFKIGCKISLKGECDGL
jgi:hypothetical protein